MAGVLAAPSRGETFARSGTTHTFKLASLAGGRPIFVKIYYFRRLSGMLKLMLRGTLLGLTRAQKEWRALEMMRRARLGCAEPVAWGLRREGPFVREAFVMTAEAFRGGEPLDHILIGRYRGPGHARERRRIMESLADSVREMHAAGFAHGDLFLRNIVACREGETWRFCVLDCPKAAYSGWTATLAGGAIVDLAQLEAGARYLTTRSERLRFLLRYAGVKVVRKRQRTAIERIMRLMRRFRRKERRRIIAAGQHAGTPDAAPGECAAIQAK